MKKIRLKLLNKADKKNYQIILTDNTNNNMKGGYVYKKIGNITHNFFGLDKILLINIDLLSKLVILKQFKIKNKLIFEWIQNLYIYNDEIS